MAKKKLTYGRTYHNSIAEALQACPNLNPPSNRIIPDPKIPGKCKLEKPFPQGSKSAAFVMEGIAIKLRTLTKLNIELEFQYIEDGEIKSDKVIRNTQGMFFESLRKLKEES